jgi:uncharacterized protein
VIAVDTNILVYAHRREPREHARAKEIVRDLAESAAPWAIPWPCIYEFHSVVTHPRIWGRTATTPEGAWSQIEAWLGSPSLRLIGETKGFPEVLGDLARHPRVRGPIIHDARVAAICLAHGVERLYTRDRDFALFPELPRENPIG